MALEFKIAPSFVTEQGDSITVSDTTDWCDYTRADFALFLTAEKESSSGVSVIELPEQIAPSTIESWIIPSATDGKYTFKLYVFDTASAIPAVGKVIYDKILAIFTKWDGAVWNEILFSEAVESPHSLEELVIPVLFNSRTYKTSLLLEYVTSITTDDHSHKDKNRLFYERSELDHFNALLIATEYSFGLSLFTTFYDTLKLMKSIIISNTD
jgi:hypothetical protein